MVPSLNDEEIGEIQEKKSKLEVGYGYDASNPHEKNVSLCSSTINNRYQKSRRRVREKESR